MLTRNEVIKARQGEIVNEVFSIEERLQELQAEVERLTMLKEQRMVEHQLLDEMGDRSILGTPVPGRKQSRMTFEDCMVQINSQVGRPIKIKELIELLEKFGYQWSSYHTAYAYITSSPIVESSGARGYYNILAKRGWE